MRYTSGMHYVYVLSNGPKRRYVGETANLKRRFLEHNGNQNISTKNRGEHELLWYAAFISKELACDFERYLKSSSGHAFANRHFMRN